MAKMLDIEKQLREAVKHGELSRYRLSKLSRVSEGQLGRFILDRDDPRHRTLTLTSAARVAKVLGLELKSVRKPKKRKE